MKIFPKPLSVKETGDKFIFKEMTACKGIFPSAVDYLSTITERKFGFKFKPSEQAEISLQKEEMKIGEYRIMVNEAGVQIFTASLEGAIYAAGTLFQMIEKTLCGFAINCAEILDKPCMPIRGVHMYLPSEKNIPVFKRILDMMAAVKMNTVIIEVGGGMKYDRHPEINESWERFCTLAREEFPGVDRSYSLQWSDKYWKDSVHTELACDP